MAFLEIRDDEWQAMEAARQRAEAQRAKLRRPVVAVVNIPPRDPGVVLRFTTSSEHRLSETILKGHETRRINKQKNARRLYYRAIGPGLLRTDRLRRNAFLMKGRTIYRSAIGPVLKGRRRIQNSHFWVFDLDLLRPAKLGSLKRQNLRAVATAICSGLRKSTMMATPRKSDAERGGRGDVLSQLRGYAAARSGSGASSCDGAASGAAGRAGDRRLSFQGRRSLAA